jgi:hypothetical protein
MPVAAKPSEPAKETKPETTPCALDASIVLMAPVKPKQEASSPVCCGGMHSLPPWPASAT